MIPFFEYEGIVSKENRSIPKDNFDESMKNYVSFTFRTCNEIWFYKYNVAMHVSKVLVKYFIIKLSFKIDKYTYYIYNYVIE